MYSSRLSGSGEWCEMEIRVVVLKGGGGGGTEESKWGVAVFSCSLFLASPHYLNAWNRLVQFNQTNPQLNSDETNG